MEKIKCNQCETMNTSSAKYCSGRGYELPQPDMPPQKPDSELLLYQSEDGKIRIQVHLEENAVWLTQADMVELFQSSKSNISEHIKHIFEEGELDENVVVRNFRITTPHGAIPGKTQTANEFYSLRHPKETTITIINK